MFHVWNLIGFKTITKLFISFGLFNFLSWKRNPEQCCPVYYIVSLFYVLKRTMWNNIMFYLSKQCTLDEQRTVKFSPWTNSNWTVTVSAIEMWWKSELSNMGWFSSPIGNSVPWQTTPSYCLILGNFCNNKNYSKGKNKVWLKET